MSEPPRRRRFSWITFVGGAAAMLLVGVLWSAWRHRDVADDALRGAAAVVEAVPDLTKPTLPDAPRLPDAPIPLPK